MVLNSMLSMKKSGNDVFRTNVTGEGKSSETILTYRSLLKLIRSDDKEMGKMLSKTAKSIAEEYISEYNPLGYLMLGDYLASIYSSDIAIPWYLKGELYGITEAKEAVDYYKKLAKTNRDYACSIAEAYFVLGNAEKGKEYLIRAKEETGFPASEQGIHIAESDGYIALESLSDIQRLSVFDMRLHKSITVNFSNIPAENTGLITSFLMGYASARGAELKVDEKSKMAIVAHSYKEKTLRRTSPNTSDPINIIVNNKFDLYNALPEFCNGRMVRITGSFLLNERESYWYLEGISVALSREPVKIEGTYIIVTPIFKEIWV